MINGRLKRPEDYTAWVKTKFPQMATEIINLVEKIKSEGRNEILPEDLVSDVPTEVKPVQQINDFTKPDEIIESNYNGDRNGIERMYTRFSNAIIALAIYDKTTGKPANPNRASREFENMLNQKMFEFKESLIADIAKFTGIEYTPGFVSERGFEIAIQNAIGAFHNKITGGNLTFKDKTEEQTYFNALDAYTILKNFDKLLAQTTPFVKVKNGFEHVEAKNRYEFAGARTEIWTTWTTEEAVDINDQISDVVKILLNYFTEYNDNGFTTTPISQTGFYQVMTSFKRWLASEPLTSEDLHKTIDGEREYSRIERISDELLRLYNGDPDMLKKYFNRFCEVKGQSFVGTNFSKDKLRGIKQMMDSKIDVGIKDMIWNLAFKTEKNIVETTSVHNGAISNKRLEDNYKRLQWFRVQSMIVSKVHRFRHTEKDALQKFCKKYGIKEKDGVIVLFSKEIGINGKVVRNPNIPSGVPEITITKYGKGSFNTEVLVDGKVVSSAEQIDDDFAKRFIEDLFETPVPDNYSVIIDQLANGGSKINLMSLYGNAIGFTLHAALDTGVVDFINENQVEREQANLKEYNRAFDPLQEFLGKAYSTDITPVNRNEFGNNVAAYTLTSMIHQIDRIVLKLESSPRNSYRSNPVLKQFRENVGQIIARGDINIMGKKKQAKSLTVNEVSYAGIICDFWNSFIKEYGDGESNYITFQNITNSDKNTHHKIPYSRNFKITEDYTLQKIIDDIVSGKGAVRTNAIKAFKSAIFDARKGSYRSILENLITDFVDAFVDPYSDGYVIDSDFEKYPDIKALFDWIASKNKSLEDILDDELDTPEGAKKAIELVQNILKNNQNEIVSGFRERGIDYVKEIHTGVNDTLFHHFDTYLVSEEKFDARIKEQQRYFLQDLIDCKFELNIYADYGNIKPLRDKLGAEWFNELTGEVYLYKGDPNGDFELNPMLEAYYLSDTLLSNSFNEILFGRTWFHPDKHTIEDGEIVNGEKTDLYYARAEASRLSASYKRTVIAGATVHSFKPRKYGTASEISFAIMKDLPATVWNMLGLENKKLDSQDGSGFCTPQQSVLENWSLLDASAGWDKKTIIGDVDGKYGMPSLIKWAVYAITNERRRLSEASDIPLENTLRKMYLKMSDSDIKKIKLQHYYVDSSAKQRIIKFDNEHNIKLTETEDIYREDPNTGNYWWITNLKSEDGLATWTEIAVDKNGNVLKDEDGNKISNPRNMKFETIYDLDQIFGGAYAMQKNKRTRELEYSDVNVYVTTRLMCNEELKGYMTSYVTNGSAFKDGARNVNPVDAWYNDKPYWTSKISMLHAGLQMNADHELKDSDVTLMTQMISALIQTGYFTEEVKDIYNEIGQVVSESLGIEKELMESNEFEKIHLMLGKSLIEDFSSGSKDTIGLAQSYLMKASRELANGNIDVKIPFSDPTLKGAFIANLVSNLNKKGIRQRYAGIADVLIPSRGMITTFNVGGMRDNYSGFVKYCREQGLTRPPIDYVKNRGDFTITEDGEGNLTYSFKLDGEDHPFIKRVESIQNIDDGDYIIAVYFDENGAQRIEEIKIDSWTKFYEIKQTDKYKNAMLFTWECKPTDLRQQNTFFEVNDGNETRRMSIYELDSVASTHFLNHLWVNPDETGGIQLDSLTKEQFKKWLFIESTLKEVLPRSGFIDNSRLHVIRMKLERKVKADLRALDKGDSLTTNNAFRTIHNTQARSWLYKPNPNAELKINPNNNLSLGEIFIKTTSILHPQSKGVPKYGAYDLNRLKDFADIPLSVKIALAYDGTNLDRIVIDAFDLQGAGANLDEVLELIRFGYHGISDEQILLAKQTFEALKTIPRVKYNATSNVKVRFAEIMVGRMNAEKLGLRKGDSISEVKRAGHKFFRDRILATSRKPIDDVMSKSKYDVLLTGSNGERIFVALKSNHSDDEFLNGLRLTPAFEERDGMMYKDDAEICTKMNKKFYSTSSIEGEQYIVLVDDLSEVEEMLDSGVYDSIRYNYTTSNQKDLFKFQFKDNIDEQGYLTESVYLRRGENIIRKFKAGTETNPIHIDSFFNDINLEALADQLNVNEENEHSEKADTIARQKYAAFEKQLYCVGARIPTQSMQSYMAMEIVGFTDSDVNEVYVPAAQTWLQGSDYDIDKLYIMIFELSKKGTVPTFSRLQNEVRFPDQLNKILDLKYPTGITYNEGPIGTFVTRSEVIGAISLQDVTGFNKVLEGQSENVTFDENVSDVEKKEFLRMLNKHSRSNFKGRQKTSALKNAVVHKIINLLKHPRLHVPSHTPINMDVLQKLASNSALSRREKTLTSDSPLVKFIMQVQNMIGKDVIGITAVGMKVFFAMSTFVNERIVDLVEALKENDTAKIKEYLHDIIFVDKTTGNLCTIANVNLEPIYEYLNQFNEEVLLDFDFYGKSGLKSIFAEVGITASLKDTLEARRFLQNCGLTEEEINELEEDAAMANIDAADSISQLLSAATDNAKELILAKINATADFADSWVYLMTSGWPVEKIGNLLMSPVFGIVSEYTKTNVFSDIIKGSSPEKAIKFVLGKAQMSGVNLKALKLIMGAYRKGSEPEKDNNCFANKLIFETYSEDTTDSNGKTHWRGELKLDRFGNPIKRTHPLLTDAELDVLIGPDSQGSDFRKNLFSILGRCESNQEIADSTAICKILEEHLEYVLRTKIHENKIYGLDDSEAIFEQMIEEANEDSFESEEVSQDEFDEFENDERRINNEDFGADDEFKISIKDVRDLYRYTLKYLVPKQNRLLEVVTDENGEGWKEVKKLKDYYEHIYPGVKEQQMCGTSLGVNQGLATDQYSFYSKLKKMQNFINEALSNEEVPFNIFDFLMDKKIIEYTPMGPIERSYRDEWIKKYDEVKIKVNPLKLIWNVDHFREMYKLNGMAYKFMNHSFAAKLNFKLEALLLKDSNQALSEEEWKVLDKYTRDLIMMNWLFSKNISFTVPVEKIGDKTKAVMTWSKNDYGEEILDSHSDSSETITLQDAESAASFVHVFETYIVPYIKEHFPNAFTRNIETGHVLSKVHNHLIMHKKLSMNTMMIDSSAKTKTEYAEILKSFNEISNEVIPEVGLTVKDALFIYNTLVYKNAFTENGFTRLMESVNLIQDDSLINDYSAFIAALDYGDVDLGNIDENISSLVDDDQNLQLGTIKGNLKDLMYRLSFTPNAAHKFSVTSEKDSNGAITRLRFVDMFDHDIAPAIDVDNANPNDWTLDMPVYGQTVFSKRVKGYGEGKQKRFTVTSREVVLAIKDSLIEKFNLQDKVQEIREEDIREAWDNPDNSKLSIRNAAEYQRIRKSKAFMNNGIIYLNMDNMSGETMLHEIMHVIFAGAKFNKDPEVQKVYYGLLDAAMKYIKQPQNRELYVKLAQMYSEEKGSDFKEEVLIYLLTESFMKQMTVKFGGVRFDSNIKPFVVDLVNDVCETSVPHDVDAVKLGHTTVDKLFVEFKSKLLDLDGNPLTTVNIQLSQKLKTLKRILIQAG